MDFVEPRKAYHRAATDDFELAPKGSNIELSSYPSTSTFRSGFSNTIRDQHPLLDDEDPVRVEPSFFSKGFFKSLKLPFVIWPTRLYGWRTGALTAALLAGISLLINLIVVIWLGAHGRGSNLVELYSGDCGKVEKTDVWVHLAINILSTLLLGGSNYCMQCLSAPTRQDIDRAHAKGKFLDVGVPSARNLRRIPVYKMLLWWALGLSSVPLHLLYNSAFYKSLATNDYNLYFVTQDFVDGQPFESSTAIADTYNPTGFHQTDSEHIQQSLLANPQSWERLDKKDCINAYASNFLSNRRNLILVSNNSTAKANESVLEETLYTFTTEFAFDWICEVQNSDTEPKANAPVPSYDRSRPCETYVSKIAAVADQWQPEGYDVQYCLSERVPEQCSYSGNVPIVAVVVVANAIKLIVMLFVAFRLGDHPLITVGDAVESFLDHNDKTTEGLCLLTRNDVIRAVRYRKHWTVQGQQKYGKAVIGKLARRQRERWAAAASVLRWSLTVGCLLLALVVSSFLLSFAIKTIESNGFTVAQIGFGKVVPTAIISGWDIGTDGDASSKILGSIVIANLPQTILSFLYLNLNGLLTSMWLASEWSDFASERKTLRVSKPKGKQRSTHFLQLPYKIALPLMVLSGLLHWLISQSIFLAVIAEYDPAGNLYDPIAIASCGFSPLAIIVVIVFGGSLIVATFALGWFRRYDASMPLVGSCSAAIAAACHQPDWDTDASVRAVQWGVIPDVVDSKRVGHCAFSSGEVQPLLEGKEYAGVLHGNQRTV